jgi:hypothetical protein
VFQLVLRDSTQTQCYPAVTHEHLHCAYDCVFITACCNNNKLTTQGKMKKEVTDLDGLRYMMNMLKEVRARESGIDMEINPILNMYRYV